jgi:hypothetical protein
MLGLILSVIASILRAHDVKIQDRDARGAISAFPRLSETFGEEQVVNTKLYSQVEA